MALNYFDFKCKSGFQKILNSVANFIVSGFKRISPTAVGFLCIALLKKSHIDKVNENQIVKKYNSIDTATDASKFITETKKQVLSHDLKIETVKDLNLEKMNNANI